MYVCVYREREGIFKKMKKMMSGDGDGDGEEEEEEKEEEDDDDDDDDEQEKLFLCYFALIPTLLLFLLNSNNAEKHNNKKTHKYIHISICMYVCMYIHICL